MRLTSLLAMLLLSGCMSKEQMEADSRLAAERQEQRRKANTKLVESKDTAVEQRLSWVWFDEQNLRTRAKTVYYLYSDDGHYAEVSQKEYHAARVGQEFYSTSWRK